MKLRQALIGLCFPLFSLAGSNAQSTPAQPIAIDPHSPQLHLVKQTVPEYPPIALAARVSGDVQIDVLIGPDGHILSAKPRSGPPMLIGAAQDCVREWVYEPVLVDNQAVTASTLVTLTFNATFPRHRPDEKIAAKFEPLLNA